MVSETKLKRAITKAVDFLLQSQKENGAWVLDNISSRHPRPYLKSITLTSECLQTLIYAQKYSTKSIPIFAVQKALHYCINYELASGDNVDLWAWKLLALRFGTTSFFQKKQKEIAKFIIKIQTSRGYWPRFPTTFNLTNFSAVSSLKGAGGFDKSINKTARWLQRTKAADNLGWGHDNTAQKSETTFTSTAILCLLMAGNSPISPEIQIAAKFLENKQFSNGGWASSVLVNPKIPGIYATSIALMSLMQISKNPFNKIVEKGIRFLLSSQNPDGSWPVRIGEKGLFYHPTYYAVKTFSMYLFLKEQLRREDILQLKSSISTPQQLYVYLVNKFEKDVKHLFQDKIRLNVLNSRVLGITSKAIRRRKEILRIIGEKGEKTTADLIDELKKLPEYEHLNKKSHLTQIKADIEFLRSLNVINEIDNGYYTTHSVLK